MAKYVFDIESLGVDFANPAWVHDSNEKAITVICAIDRDSGQKYVYRHDDQSLCDGDIKQGLQRLAQADWLGGHNIHGFDLPYIQACYPEWKPKAGATIRDSKVESEMWYPANELRSKDFAAERKYGKWIEKKLYGRHSLEAWGQRIGRHLKDDFKKRMEAIGLDPWSASLPEPYATERVDYCVEDVRVNVDLFEYLEAKFPYEDAADAVRIENRVARILTKQTQWGVAFNAEAAYRLHSEMMAKKLELEARLKDIFKPFYLRKGKLNTPKRSMRRKNKDHGYTEHLTAGEPFVPVKLVEFNPGSRQHIANRLIRLYGWKPTELTESGEPKVDETVLAALPYAPCPLLMEYLLVDKRLGQMAEGAQAWFHHDRNGRIHGRVNQNGTRTTRASHHSPNMGQVPKVKKNKDGTLKTGLAGGWGAEMRALFGPSPGRVQVGVDLSGIELRALGHYMARYDGGAYSDLVINGDVHGYTRVAIQFNSRDNTKTAEYAYLYGAGDFKLGLITYDDMTAEQRKAFGPVTKRKLTALGKKTRSLLIKGLNGMEPLVAACHGAAKRGWMRALDGRKLSVPSQHSSLNTLLQHLGGLTAKQWMVEVEDRLMSEGLVERDSWVAWPSDKVAQVLWVHDELQFDCVPEAAQQCKDIAVLSAGAAGEHFGLRVRVDAEAKTGANWKECH